MMSQLSHKHLLLNYGVCVYRDESECTSDVCDTQRRNTKARNPVHRQTFLCR